MKTEIGVGKRVVLTALANLVLLPLAACKANPTPVAATSTPGPIKIIRGETSAGAVRGVWNAPVAAISAARCNRLSAET